MRKRSRLITLDPLIDNWIRMNCENASLEIENYFKQRMMLSCTPEQKEIEKLRNEIQEKNDLILKETQEMAYMQSQLQAIEQDKDEDRKERFQEALNKVQSIKNAGLLRDIE